MFAVLRHYGISVGVVNAISALYINSKVAVLVDGNISDPFVFLPESYRVMFYLHSSSLF